LGVERNWSFAQYFLGAERKFSKKYFMKQSWAQKPEWLKKKDYFTLSVERKLLYEIHPRSCLPHTSLFISFEILHKHFKFPNYTILLKYTIYEY
jgi:hypothetical protein